MWLGGVLACSAAVGVGLFVSTGERHDDAVLHVAAERIATANPPPRQREDRTRPEHGSEQRIDASVAPTRSFNTPEVDFNLDVLPILSNHCFKCHGPDAAERKAGLRLDTRDGAMAALEDGGFAVVPGLPESSELIARVSSNEDDFRMPPPEEGKRLDERDIEVLRRWIEIGASWEMHWAFVPPTRPPLPTVSDESWCRNGIDRFILARLDSEGLSPSPEEERVRLIRRVSLDLTGLSPTPEEVDAFLADDRPDAYERVVDRLLASDRYGEHMARYWLDAARYGDTHGLHLDNERIMWPWRDWVIDAFNRNIPFDVFTLEQLAGDLLPGATHQQRIATGFNRNHVTTSEGGAIDDEYLMKYAADRTETVATVWMGLTVGCAQCHDHKFDPVTQREYYELFAFFNNTTDAAMDGNARAPEPAIRVPTPEQASRLAELTDAITHARTQVDAPMPEVDAAQEAWRQRVADRWRNGWETPRVTDASSTGGATLRLLDDGSVLAEGPNPDKDAYEVRASLRGAGYRLLRLESLLHESLPYNGPGRAPNANFVLSEIEADVWPSGRPEACQSVRFVAAGADHEQMNGPFPVSHAIDGIIDQTNGWAVEGFNRREARTAVFVTDRPIGFEGGTEVLLRLRFETHFPQHAIGRLRASWSADATLMEAMSPVSFGPWHAAGPFGANDGREAYAMVFEPEERPGDVDLATLYREGRIAWVERPDFVDGRVHELTGSSCATYLFRTVRCASPRTLDFFLGSDDAIKMWVNGELVHANDVARPAAPDQDRVTVNLHAGENAVLLKIVNLQGGYAFYFRPSGQGAANDFMRVVDAILDQSPDGDERIRRHFRSHHAEAMRQVYERLASLEQEHRALEASLPTTLVMQERTEPRETFVLFRGEYDKPRERVQPGVPAVLGRIQEDPRPNRLHLARWLVSGSHPLTARVTVNRLWQQTFGTGIVKTAEDFGVQGERPSHPRLLDWLAVEFVDSHWDVKHLLRLMVTSATYRQSSRVPRGLWERDPENRLLARGPRHRLDAEVIRDQALYAAGLLVERIGGPSVKPYQPEGLWEAVAYTDSNTRTFRKDDGDAQYRRSLYTYWKRTSPPPNLMAFDAPMRETCVVRRTRTTTPLQALVLLNDPQFVEAARALAERAIVQGGADPIERLVRLVLGRPPNGVETHVLTELYERLLERYRADTAAAASLLTTGDSPRDPSLDPAVHAAMTNVATAVLSLDEAVCK